MRHGLMSRATDLRDIRKPVREGITFPQSVKRCASASRAEEKSHVRENERASPDVRIDAAHAQARINKRPP